jgi:hypothetical protein
VEKPQDRRASRLYRLLPNHFDKDGNPSETLLRAKQDRLENWRLLQELAGTLGKGKPAAKPAAEKPAAKPAAATAGNGHAPAKGANGLPGGLGVGSRIRYKDPTGWVTGVVESADPLVLGRDSRRRDFGRNYRAAVGARLATL